MNIKGINWYTACPDQECVQVGAADGDTLYIRDSKTGTALRFSKREIRNFFDGVREGTFDHLL